MIDLLITVIAVGVLLWVVGLIPMDATVRQILRAIVIVALCIWLLKVTGLLAHIGRVHF